MTRTLYALAALTALATTRLDGNTMPEPISYTLRFPAPQTHTVDVEAAVPTGGQPAVELMMAVWTPGSYLVREFARQIESVAAFSDTGEPLAVEKTAKNRWRVETRGLPRVIVLYRLYAREMSVRTNFVERDFAILNGASTFLTLVPQSTGEKRPHDVRVVLPPEWKVAVSPLPPLLGGGEHSFRAEDFDTLVDSPLYAGNARLYPFEAGGKPHLLVNEGEGDVWDGPRSATETERVIREHLALWGSPPPYPRYVILNMITEASGGLEHRDSTLLMTSRWKARTREGRLDWLGLVSHEFFHVWNVKRLRPLELGPFDYENEVYTRALWVAEGITSYYDDLLVHRAGLSTRKEFLERLSKQIESLQTTPGRLAQPLDESSFDAWIKYYRKDENSPNTTVSYYTKGAIVSFLLDARIRRATDGRKSLDDALRLAYQRHSSERGFTAEEFRQVLEETTGASLEAWLRTAIETTEELDYSEALAWFGLRFAESEEEPEKGETPEKPGEVKEKAGWLGIETEMEEGRLLVTEVRRGTPGFEAGVNVDDEILAIGDYRVPPDSWGDRLKAYRPGQEETLLVARRERLVRLPVTFGEKPKPRWKLEVAPSATPEQRGRLEAWLGSSTRTPTP